jgi:hypothetical protein
VRRIIAGHTRGQSQYAGRADAHDETSAAAAPNPPRCRAPAH